MWLQDMQATLYLKDEFHCQDYSAKLQMSSQPSVSPCVPYLSLFKEGNKDKLIAP